MGLDEYLEVIGCGLLAALIVWQRRTLSELIRWVHLQGWWGKFVLPAGFVALAVFLYWHFFGWR